MRTLILQQLPQFLVVASAVVATAAARAENAPLGALTLAPLSVTAFSERASEPIVTGFVYNEGMPVLPVNNEPVLQVTGPASSPDFATIVDSMNARDYVGSEQVAPVPETSTWVAAALAALVILLPLRKRLCSRS